MAVAKLLLAKIEATYGTDPMPDALSAIETQDLEMLRYEGDRVAREVDRSILGGKEQVNVLPHTNTSFGVALAGSGTAGTPPAWGELFRACGFNETIDVGIDVKYALATDGSDLSNSDSVTLYDYRDQAGQLQKTNGCRGACEITMSGSELPKIAFSDFIGSYLTPISGSKPVGIDWSTWLSEVAFTKDNVPILTLDNESFCTESFNIAFGQSVSRRNLPGCESTVISDYEVTGGMTVIAKDVAAYNIWARSESHNGVIKVPFALQLGTVAGNIIEITCPEVQITEVSEGESGQGDLNQEASLSFIGDVTVAVR